MAHPSLLPNADAAGNGVAAEDVITTPQGYVLTKYGGEIVPFSEATPSEDGRFWRCKKWDGTRRCFFAPAGSV